MRIWQILKLFIGSSCHSMSWYRFASKSPVLSWNLVSLLRVKWTPHNVCVTSCVVIVWCPLCFTVFRSKQTYVYPYTPCGLWLMRRMERLILGCLRLCLLCRLCHRGQVSVWGSTMNVKLSTPGSGYKNYASPWIKNAICFGRNPDDVYVLMWSKVRCCLRLRKQLRSTRLSWMPKQLLPLWKCLFS